MKAYNDFHERRAPGAGFILRETERQRVCVCVSVCVCVCERERVE